MPSMMVQSAGVKRLRREMESRRRPELAPTGRGAKKFASRPHHSLPPPPPPTSFVLPASISHYAADERSVVLALPAPVPSRSPSSAAADEPAIKKGTQVSVRTRVGRICSGHHLVLRLDAVVVSADEDGVLGVVYKVKFPLDDPFRPVRVARDKVKVMPPAVPSVDASTGSSTVTNTAAPFSTKSKDKGAPRPTVAGKSLRLLTKLERKRAGATTP
ncbi:hypothetical protein E2562_034768 [Oryza meyeriana var. granulata]|uniref:Uncharacterized protein n=1 Tax=Oryza meyeriana var. granulata TaxID=110450 RepID=A0A6G1CKV9_9ORYZ|nr:hypothetical protein E2562_034768 [Oryza meyeriana var. granulata]